MKTCKTITHCEDVAMEQNPDRKLGSRKSNSVKTYETTTYNEEMPMEQNPYQNLEVWKQGLNASAVIQTRTKIKNICLSIKKDILRQLQKIDFFWTTLSLTFSFQQVTLYLPTDKMGFMFLLLYYSIALLHFIFHLSSAYHFTMCISPTFEYL